MSLKQIGLIEEFKRLIEAVIVSCGQNCIKKGCSDSEQPHLACSVGTSTHWQKGFRCWTGDRNRCRLLSLLGACRYPDNFAM